MKKEKIMEQKDTPLSYEKNDTAAWASIESLKEGSKVHVPAQFQVKNSKDYVDKNEK